MQALLSESLPTLGACVSAYWAQKKVMAPGCEPAVVSRIIEATRPLALGSSMAGAGGGGFMFVLARAPEDVPAIQQAVQAVSGDVRFHAASIDRVGLVVRRVAE